METKDILKTLRKSKGFANAKEFCDAADISFNTYQNYESGKRLPTAEILMQIADFYGVSADYLLGREKPDDPLEVMGIKVRDVDDDAFIKMYRELPDNAKCVFLDVMKKLAGAGAGERENELTVSTECGAPEDSAREKDDISAG